jgi:hypothetical protein
MFGELFNEWLDRRRSSNDDTTSPLRTGTQSHEHYEQEAMHELL